MDTNKNNEKILKILIVIGIIAILVSVYIQYLKPFIAELLVQKKDQIRIRDISLINSALNKFRKINPDFFLGESNKVYISLPSTQLNCEGLELPSLTDGWEYRCQPEIEYKKIDGNGWIPVDFTKLPGNSFFKLLPVDPVNSANELSYYTYITGEGWALTSLLGSNKFIKQSALNDGGSDPSRLEVGSGLQLWAKVSGLVGYWKLDEGEGTVVIDSSGNNNTGIITNGPNWVNGKIGKALNFDGVDDYIVSRNDSSINNPYTNGYTLEAWVNKKAANGAIVQFNRYSFQIAFSGDNAQVYVWGCGVTSINSLIPLLNNQWYHIVVTWGANDKIKLYINSILQGESNSCLNLNNGGGSELPVYIGSDLGGYNFFNGIIDEVRIYNKALSAEEVRTIYNTTK